MPRAKGWRNAKVSSPRDGTGNVYIAIVSTTAQAPTEEEIQIVQEYINAKRPVGLTRWYLQRRVLM